MNTSSLMESPTSKKKIINQIQSIHSTNIIHPSQLVHTPHTQMENQMLNSSLTGKSVLEMPLMDSEQVSLQVKEIKSEKILSSLQSNAKPHEILEKAPEPKVLKLSKYDLFSLAQVMREFMENTY
jgi:hypothetical protein